MPIRLLPSNSIECEPCVGYLQLEMKNSQKVGPKSKDIFERLANHGFARDYAQIKKIVAFDLPQWSLFYVRQFGKRTLADVLMQIERWKVFLGGDFFLLADQRTQIQEWIHQSENLVWMALIEVNVPSVGPWELVLDFIPTGGDEYGQSIYIWPPLRIRAFNRKTKEVRKSIISSDDIKDPARRAGAYRTAFEKLEIWNRLNKGLVGHCLVSRRRQQGWPLFTQKVIPQLYELMMPRYRMHPHYSETLDLHGERQNALFPNELFADMLELLRVEHPSIFAQTTTSQLKSVIQRYLTRKRRGTNSR